MRRMKFPLKGETTEQRFNELLGTVTHVSHAEIQNAIASERDARRVRRVENAKTEQRREIGRQRRARARGGKA